jgi:hypothetical protein
MIKLVPEITQNNLFESEKPERSPQKPLRISCQSVLIPCKIPDAFYMKYPKNTSILNKSTRK